MALKNLTPSPFIRIFLEDKEDILIDCDNKTRYEIHDYLKKIICKSEKQIIKEEDSLDIPEPSDFGWGCERQCICAVQGQVPCPGVVVMPDNMRGKYVFNLVEED